jgi:hypothetical protein
MSLFLNKLGFTRRCLMERDGFYRVALFFGPAALVGAASAATVWGCIVAVQSVTYAILR